MPRVDIERLVEFVSATRLKQLEHAGASLLAGMAGDQDENKKKAARCCVCWCMGCHSADCESYVQGFSNDSLSHAFVSAGTLPVQPVIASSAEWLNLMITFGCKTLMAGLTL